MTDPQPEPGYYEPDWGDANEPNAHDNTPVDDHQSSTAPDPEADSESLYLQLKTYASIMEKDCMIQSASLPLRIFALTTGYWIQLAMLQCLTIHDYTIYRRPNNSRMLVIDSKCPFGDTNAVKKMLTAGFAATDGAQSDVIIVPEGTDLVSVEFVIQ